MATVFINYRTSDVPNAATLLKQGLEKEFGADEIFLASDTGIPPGSDFELELVRRVHGADVLLAVVGPRWLSAPAKSGGRALDDDTDWVRREIAEAFTYRVRVVPVLVDDTARLTGATLPADIEALTRCQSFRLRHESTRPDLRAIADELTEFVPALRRRRAEHSPSDQRTVFEAHATDQARIYQAGRDQHVDW